MSVPSCRMPAVSLPRGDIFPSKVVTLSLQRTGSGFTED